jgi:hypothetical protein
MQEQYVKGMTFNNMSIMLPWFSNLIDEDRALLGDDWWPSGHRVPDQLEEVAHRRDYRPIRRRSTAVSGLR